MPTCLPWLRKFAPVMAVLGATVLVGCSTLPGTRSAADRSPALTRQEEALMAFVTGQLADMRQDYQRAAEAYRQALRADPDSLTLRRHLINDLILLKRYPEALHEYEALALRSPKDAGNFLAQAELHDAAGNTGQAETCYLKAVAEKPGQAAPAAALGLLYLRLEREAEAVNWLEKALKLDPANREARRSLIQYHLSRSHPGPAEKLLRAGVALMPEDLQWLAGLASLVAEDNRRAEEAAALFQKLAVSHPAYPEAHRYLANHFVHRKQWEAAATHLEQLLRWEPETPGLRRQLALVYYQSGHLSPARDLLMGLVREGREDAFTHYLLGAVYRKKNHLYLAADEFRTALKQDSNLPEAYFGLAQILAETGELENASALLAKAREKFPQAPDFLLISGMIYLKQGKLDQALHLLEQSAARMPDHGLAHFYLGRALEQAGRFPEAVQAWKKAVRVAPQEPEPYNYLAYSHAVRGERLDQALAWVNQALVLEPENGFYLDTRGWIYFKQKKHAQALKQLLRARDIMDRSQDPDPVVYEHLGDVYHELKDGANARQAWKRAQELDPKNEVVRKKLEAAGAP